MCHVSALARGGHPPLQCSYSAYHRLSESNPALTRKDGPPPNVLRHPGLSSPFLKASVVTTPVRQRTPTETVP